MENISKYSFRKQNIKYNNLHSINTGEKEFINRETFAISCERTQESLQEFKNKNKYFIQEVDIFLGNKR